MPSLAGADATPAAGGLRAGFVRAWRLLRGGQSSPAKVAASCAVGLFIGCLPLYGLHFVLCLGVCLLFRLDLVIAYVAANVSNPLVAPFLLTAEIELGSWLLHGRFVGFDAARARALGPSGFLAQAAVGSVVIGALLAAAGGALAWLFSARKPAPSSPLDAARARTLARYANARIADRKYVEGKLWYDPVVERIAGLGLELGAVLDAGAGRGQLGLLLLELGQATKLGGFDLDERKIEVARHAARGEAAFEVADLARAELSSFDTLLLVDVLHYLSEAAQARLLERAARALAPGGRMLIRETDGAKRRSGLFTRAAERLARLTGWHRGNQALCFLPLAELVTKLEALGLRTRTLDASHGTPFSNQLIVAEKSGGAEGALNRAGT
jgi:uncharacterized protein (DUF2062 family)/2-polyprenyl-3-methyl-5-hydroxy-6-metoxy-1,4-benzoquinol methylase